MWAWDSRSLDPAREQPEAWFDPAKPVTVFFTRLGGETTSTVGVLPLHHAVVVGDLEYRFSVVAGSIISTCASAVATGLCSTPRGTM